VRINDLLILLEFSCCWRRGRDSQLLSGTLEKRLQNQRFPDNLGRLCVPPVCTGAQLKRIRADGKRFPPIARVTGSRKSHAPSSHRFPSNVRGSTHRSNLGVRVCSRLFVCPLRPRRPLCRERTMSRYGPPSAATTRTASGTHHPPAVLPCAADNIKTFDQ
jgi:hypothetical protein